MQAAGGTAITVQKETATPSPVRLRLLAVGIAVVGIVLDQVTKTIAIDRLDPNQPIPVIDGLLILQLIRNPGAAFSMKTRVPLSGATPTLR